MQFAFTQEQNELRKMVREFAGADLAPHVLAWDEAQEFPFDAVKKAGALGLLGVIFPEEFGELFGSHGVSNDHTIVLYGDRNNWFAAYTYWYPVSYTHLTLPTNREV